MNPLFVRIGAVAVAAAAVVALLGAGQPDVTKARLERSLADVYPNLYGQQAALLGHPGVSRQSMRARPHCGRGGPKVADVGSGSDWICFIDFIDDKGAAQHAKMEVTAKSNACYVATGPSRITGPLRLTDTHGQDVLNPVFEYDACYDPAS